MTEETKNMEQRAQEYDASQIQVLEGFRSCSHASRHVYRFDFERRASSPCMGNC